MVNGCLPMDIIHILYTMEMQKEDLTSREKRKNTDVQTFRAEAGLFMAFFLIKNSTDLKHIIFSLPEDYPKPPLFTMTILYNNCGIKIHLYKANTKKNSAANGYSNLLPNGTGVISVIWT